MKVHASPALKIQDQKAAVNLELFMDSLDEMLPEHASAEIHLVVKNGEPAMHIDCLYREHTIFTAEFLFKYEGLHGENWKDALINNILEAYILNLSPNLPESESLLH